MCVFLCAERAIHHWASLDEVRALIGQADEVRALSMIDLNLRKRGGFQCPVSQCLASKEKGGN